jgi:hypothetical protein
MTETAEHDPHVGCDDVQVRLQTTIDGLRADCRRFDDPELHAMVCTALEVLEGLKTAFVLQDRRRAAGGQPRAEREVAARPEYAPGG